MSLLRVDAADLAAPRAAAGEAQASLRAAPGLPAAGARRWRSSKLFGASPEIEIEHGAAIYRLRRTALGKLILTK